MHKHPWVAMLFSYLCTTRWNPKFVMNEEHVGININTEQIEWK